MDKNKLRVFLKRLLLLCFHMFVNKKKPLSTRLFWFTCWMLKYNVRSLLQPHTINHATDIICGIFHKSLHSKDGCLRREFKIKFHDIVGIRMCMSYHVRWVIIPSHQIILNVFVLCVVNCEYRFRFMHWYTLAWFASNRKPHTLTQTHTHRSVCVYTNTQRHILLVFTC